MSDKLVKTIMDGATLTGLAAGIGWLSTKVVKENMTNDPSGSVMTYVKFTAAASVLNSTLRNRKSYQIPFECLVYIGQTYDGQRCNDGWRRYS